MPKFRYNIGYEVHDAEVIIEATTKDEADAKLDTVLATLTVFEATGGFVVGPWVNSVEEVS